MGSLSVLTIPAGPLQPTSGNVPTLFVDAGSDAVRRFIEFFTANIRNRNTRAAYAFAVSRFARWCDARGISLAQLTPVIVAAYIEELGQHLDKPSVKQHLAALRMLFDYLVTGQVLPTNPAYAVRGPKHVVKTGRTPVLSAEETRILLDHIDVNTIAGLRDRAMIGVMVYSFARVGAVVGMNVEDYFQEGKRWWFRLHEKGRQTARSPSASQCRGVCGRLSGSGRRSLTIARDRSFAAWIVSAICTGWRCWRRLHPRAVAGAGHDQTARPAGWTAADDLLPHLPGHRHHHLPAERWYN